MQPKPTNKITVHHPLDQLTPSEVARATACTRAHAAAAGVPGALRFNTIMLDEPPKRQLIDYNNGRGPCPARRATVWVMNPPHGTLFEGVVELGGPHSSGDKMVAWTKVRPRCFTHRLVRSVTMLGGLGTLCCRAWHGSGCGGWRGCAKREPLPALRRFRPPRQTQNSSRPQLWSPASLQVLTMQVIAFTLI